MDTQQQGFISTEHAKEFKGSAIGDDIAALKCDSFNLNRVIGGRLASVG